MTVFLGFVMIQVIALLVLQIRYFIKTKDLTTLLSIALQTAVISTSVHVGLNNTGTNNLFEIFCIGLGVVVPGVLLLFDKPQLKMKIAWPAFRFMKSKGELLRSRSEINEIIPEKRPEIILSFIKGENVMSKIEERLNLAHKEIEREHFGKASTIYSSLMEIINNPYLYFNCANLLYRSGEYKEALKYYTSALKGLEQFYSNKNETKDVKKGHPSFRLETKEVYFNLGNTLFKLGKFSDSLVHYQNAIEIDKDFKPALDNYIQALVKLKNFEEAVRCCKEIVKKESDYKHHFILAKIYFEINKPEKCIRELKRALEINDKHADSIALLGEIYSSTENTKEAIEAYVKLTKLCPGDAAAQYSLGKLLLANDRYEEAIDRFQQAISFNPEMFEAYYNIAISYERKGDSNQAVSTYKQLIAVKSDFISAYTRLWDLMIKQSRFMEIIEICKRGIEKSPQEYILYFYVGVAYSKMGRYEESLEFFKNVLEINPDMKGANLYLGIALTKLRKYEEAILMFRNALLEAPNDNEVFYNMSITYCLQERYDKALDSLKKAVELNPELRDKVQDNSIFECLKEKEEFRVIALN